jgi:hypothetical protein
VRPREYVAACSVYRCRTATSRNSGVLREFGSAKFPSFRDSGKFDSGFIERTENDDSLADGGSFSISQGSFVPWGYTIGDGLNIRAWCCGWFVDGRVRSSYRVGDIVGCPKCGSRANVSHFVFHNCEYVLERRRGGSTDCFRYHAERMICRGTIRSRCTLEKAN